MSIRIGQSLSSESPPEAPGQPGSITKDSRMFPGHPRAGRRGAGHHETRGARPKAGGPRLGRPLARSSRGSLSPACCPGPPARARTQGSEGDAAAGRTNWHFRPSYAPRVIAPERRGCLSISLAQACSVSQALVGSGSVRSCTVTLRLQRLDNRLLANRPEVTVASSTDRQPRKTALRVADGPTSWFR